MVDVIDVHDLPEEEVQHIQIYVEKIREKYKNQKTVKEAGQPQLRSWPMNAKSTFSRKELY